MKTTGRYSFTQKEGRQVRIVYSRKGEILPGITMLGHAYPNPFAGETTIPLLLDEDASEIRVEVYNLLGQRLRTLSKRYSKGGMHTMTWDGKDEHGSDIASGILLYRLSDGTGDVKRMIKQ
jgi:flagellar hook assembly protein FlgD